MLLAIIVLVLIFILASAAGGYVYWKQRAREADPAWKRVFGAGSFRIRDDQGYYIRDAGPRATTKPADSAEGAMSLRFEPDGGHGMGGRIVRVDTRASLFPDNMFFEEAGPRQFVMQIALDTRGLPDASGVRKYVTRGGPSELKSSAVVFTVIPI